MGETFSLPGRSTNRDGSDEIEEESEEQCDDDFFEASSQMFGVPDGSDSVDDSSSSTE